jgi:integrase/recombinase XerD
MDLKRRKIIVGQGEGGKGRIVYLSNDAFNALAQYLRVRPSSKAKNLFLVEKGPYYGRAISVRGIQKRIEYYACKAGLKVSYHQLRHTMATRLLNADTDLVPCNIYSCG